jgi:hypothetical protein
MFARATAFCASRWRARSSTEVSLTHQSGEPHRAAAGDGVIVAPPRSSTLSSCSRDRFLLVLLRALGAWHA